MRDFLGNINEPDDYHDEYQREAMKAIGAMDKLAEQAGVQDIVNPVFNEAIPFVMSTCASLPKSFSGSETMMKLLIATHKNAYRIGFLDGQKNAETLFQPNKG